MRGTKDKSKRPRFGTTAVYPRGEARRLLRAPCHHPITKHLQGANPRMLSNVELISRPVLAAALGSVIGFERERLSWAAGTVREFKKQGPA
jgi:hypothetical protein